MKSPLSLAALGALVLSFTACDFDYLDDAVWENPYRNRVSDGSRLVHGWDSGALQAPRGAIAGRYDLINWPSPLHAKDPEGRIDGRVLKFNLVGGAPQENWGMALGWVWLPARGSLTPGQVVTIPRGDIHIVGCAAHSPGHWMFERDAQDIEASLRVDEIDPDLIHLDFNAAFHRDHHFRGSLSGRFPSSSLRSW